jgi:hypothetical protein
LPERSRGLRRRRPTWQGFRRGTLLVHQGQVPGHQNVLLDGHCEAVVGDFGLALELGKASGGLHTSHKGVVMLDWVRIHTIEIDLLHLRFFQNVCAEQSTRFSVVLLCFG